MTQFVQLHLLTSYPPANLNRDDLNRPKTAVMGGATRLRISSQSLKRAWRTSSVFEEALADHLGTRTKEKGTHVFRKLVDGGMKKETAFESAKKIAGVFGKISSAKIEKEEVETEQLVHYSPEELEAIDQLAEALLQEKRSPTDEEVKLLKHDHRAVDIGLFGRMLAAAPSFNVEAAAQVAHALSVHRVQVEDDFYSAVDDLNERAEDMGAGHLGETEFGAGLFYLYLCIDRDRLVENLAGDDELAGRALRALGEAATTVAPRGKQASFASRAYASYVLAETGRAQPRSLAVSFLGPVGEDRSRNDEQDYLSESIERLETTCDRLEAAYGPTREDAYTLNVPAGTGTLGELLDFVARPLPEGS